MPSVVLKMQRLGTRNLPVYRLVAGHHHGRRDGKCLEVLGTYHPRVNIDNQKTLDLKMDRVKYWLGNGAEMTDAVGRLLAVAGLAPTPYKVMAHRVRRETADRVWEQFRTIQQIAKSAKRAPEAAAPAAAAASAGEGSAKEEAAPTTQ